MRASAAGTSGAESLPEGVCLEQVVGACPTTRTWRNEWTAMRLETLLAAYWAAHDWTGSASVIFCHSAAQRDVAIAVRGQLQQTLQQRVATRLRPATASWEA